jgi:hypothetical protein
MDNQKLFGMEGVRSGERGLTEKEIFKPTGWATLYPKVRGDLIFLFDEGYYPVVDNFTSFQPDCQIIFKPGIRSVCWLRFIVRARGG